MFSKILLFLFFSMFIYNGCSKKNQEEFSKEKNSAGKITITENVVKEQKSDGKSEENSGQFYYSYNKEKNSTQSDETSKIRTVLDAYRNIRSPYERVQITLMVQQLSPDYKLLCSACHDDYANGVIGPAIIDKNATYIYNQIIAFKTGKRKNVLMKDLVSRIDNTRLRAIANEIERFNKEVKHMRSKK